jgi:hypothetical protein
MPRIGIGIGLGLFGGSSFSGLLDAYPNASVAYSLRLLRGAYTGSAVRVRRSSDNTEQDIGFTALGELDTTALTTFCSGTNGFVTTWYDQSGNGRNLTQAVAIAQPQIVSSGSVLLDNGKPAIVGDRINRMMASSSFVVTQPATKFIVTKSTASANNVAISGSLDTNARHQVGYVISNGGQYSLFAGASLTSATTSQLNAQVLLYALFNGASSVVKINNNADTTGNAGTQSNDGVNLGVTPAAFTGNLQEIIYYPSNQSANQSAINTLINSFYGIY